MNGKALFFASVSVFSCSAQGPLDEAASVPPPPPPGEERSAARGENQLSPIDREGYAEGDLAMTDRLRQGLMQHEALSFDAKNVKVITQGGRVTLRGAVKNAKERVDIERLALKTAGSGNVDSQLEVMP
jgi:osmotically-inducible protein OsmY